MPTTSFIMRFVEDYRSDSTRDQFRISKSLLVNKTILFQKQWWLHLRSDNITFRISNCISAKPTAILKTILQEMCEIVNRLICICVFKKVSKFVELKMQDAKLPYVFHPLIPEVPNTTVGFVMIFSRDDQGSIL